MTKTTTILKHLSEVELGLLFLSLYIEYIHNIYVYILCHIYVHIYIVLTKMNWWHSHQKKNKLRKKKGWLWGPFSLLTAWWECWLWGASPRGGHTHAVRPHHIQASRAVCSHPSSRDTALFASPFRNHELTGAEIILCFSNVPGRLLGGQHPGHRHPVCHHSIWNLLDSYRSRSKKWGYYWGCPPPLEIRLGVGSGA